LAAGRAPPGTHWESLQRSPRPPSWIQRGGAGWERGAGTREGGKGRDGEGRVGMGRGWMGEGIEG